MGRPYRFIDTDIEAFFKRPGIKVLDLCCCSGLAAEGMIKAGVNVLGIDIVKPSYYPGTFMQADVKELPLTFAQSFNFIWGSPPCQFESRGTAYARSKGKQYVNLIPVVREYITASGLPGIIENIPETGIRPDFMLCGSMFNLRQWRHRHFEAVNWTPQYNRLYCNHTKGNTHTIAGSFRGSVHDAAESMGCYPGRLRSEIKEGIPPAYAQFILQSFLTTHPDFHKSPAV